MLLRATFALTALALGLVWADHGAVGQPHSERLKAIAAGKPIRIAHRTDAVPFSFVDGNKEAAGYTVDVCKSVVASLQRQLNVRPLRIEWVPVSTQSRFDVVAKGQADLECGASTVTLSRMKEVDFSNIIFVESTGIAVNISAGINRLHDLSGKKVAVIAGTSNEKAMADKNRSMQLNATLVPVKDREEAINALNDGRADAFASDKLLLYGADFKNPQTVRALPDDLSIEPYAIVLPRGEWELRLAVNTALAEVFRSGEAEKIFAKWFGQIGLRPGSLLSAVYLLGATPE